MKKSSSKALAVMVDKFGCSVQIGSTVRVGEPGRFDSHKAAFSGTLIASMEERGVVMVEDARGNEYVVEATNVSLLAKNEPMWDTDDQTTDEEDLLIPDATDMINVEPEQVVVQAVA